MPAVTLAVACLRLGEQPRPVELLGGLITLVGVAVPDRRPRTREPRADRPVPPAPATIARHHS
ncbi:hypothetical protein [Streptomyces sp. NPDC048473]|uniref:hypothetical protein n=1 Tax=unclassified Streptomyces TaxID=2593676 RepID=UPI00372174C4